MKKTGPGRKRRHVKSHTIPKSRTMRVPPSSYQPSRAELREETDMPKLSLKKMRSAFFRPFRFDQE